MDVVVNTDKTDPIFHSNPLTVLGSADNKFPIDIEEDVGPVIIQVELPEDITCSQCILQVS